MMHSHLYAYHLVRIYARQLRLHDREHLLIMSVLVLTKLHCGTTSIYVSNGSSPFEKERIQEMIH